jgi:hypothetical protein
MCKNSFTRAVEGFTISDKAYSREIVEDEGLWTECITPPQHMYKNSFTKAVEGFALSDKTYSRKIVEDEGLRTECITKIF